MIASLVPNIYNHLNILPFLAGGGKAHPGAWTEQSQVVVETVTKSTTTQKFAAATTRATADASKVVTRGAGLKRAFVDKPQTFQVDASSAGENEGNSSCFGNCIWLT